MSFSRRSFLSALAAAPVAAPAIASALAAETAQAVSVVEPSVIGDSQYVGGVADDMYRGELIKQFEQSNAGLREYILARDENGLFRSYYVDEAAA